MTDVKETKLESGPVFVTVPHSKIIIHLVEKVDEDTLDEMADTVTDLLDEDGFVYSKVDYVE